MADAYDVDAVNLLSVDSAIESARELVSAGTPLGYVLAGEALGDARHAAARVYDEDRRKAAFARVFAARKEVSGG